MKWLVGTIVGEFLKVYGAYWLIIGLLLMLYE